MRDGIAEITLFSHHRDESEAARVLAPFDALGTTRERMRTRLDQSSGDRWIPLIG